MNAATEQPSGTPPARRAVLESLELRRRTTGEAAAARSQMVRRLRIGLPLLAALLVAVFLVLARPQTGDDHFLEDFADVEATAQELTMSNPRFAGVDADGNPYEITTARSEQSADAKDVFRLEKPRAVLSNGGEDTVLTAERGVFQAEQSVLVLEDAVTLDHAIGGQTYTMTTPSARVDVNAETVESTEGVEGSAESGSLRADRMRAYNDEGRVVFEGNVSMRIFPKTAQQDAAAVRGEEPQ